MFIFEELKQKLYVVNNRQEQESLARILNNTLEFSMMQDYASAA